SVPLQQTVVDRPPASPANPVTLLTPPLWLFVLLSTVGSILVLTVWIIIFKRSKRNNVTPEPGPEPVQKAEVQTEAHLLLSDGLSQTQAPTPCVHLHLGASTESKREGGPVLDKQWLPKYSTTREHRIPLPATELGGTALVTTKTV
uniref:Uncharacterized protein n=1 Tax=Cynoglossus semilaevis TaxID=244447 RepID=A0A3P8V593_CYNSE